VSNVLELLNESLTGVDAEIGSGDVISLTGTQIWGITNHLLGKVKSG